MSDVGKSSAQLMADCQGMVRSIAWQIHRKLPSHVELEDLVGYGQIGLAEAARSFDPERSAQFTTFAYYRIRGSILDGLGKMSWFKSADFHRGRYERMATEVLDAEAAPNADAGDTQLQDDVKWLQGVSSALAVVYLVSQSSSEESGGPAIEDHAAPAPDSAVINEEVSHKLHALIDSLPADAGQLIRAAYFEGLSLKEAGERLGISKAWASRLHAKTLDQMAKRLKAAGIEE